MNKISKIFNKISFLFFLVRVLLADEMSKANVYAKFYRVKMGKKVRITGSLHFPTEAFLIEIGDNVTLTNNITFHTHDGGVGLFRNEIAGINVFGKIKIGNNVFIGSNTTILPNVKIGNNVVIGASSVVTKNIPDNVVVAGNPAKQISSLEEYHRRVLDKAVFVHSNDPRKREKEILEAMKKNQTADEA